MVVIMLAYVVALAWLLVSAAVALIRTRHEAWRAWIIGLVLIGFVSGTLVVKAFTQPIHAADAMKGLWYTNLPLLAALAIAQIHRPARPGFSGLIAWLTLAPPNPGLLDNSAALPPLPGPDDDPQQGLWVPQVSQPMSPIEQMKRQRRRRVLWIVVGLFILMFLRMVWLLS